MAFPAAFLDELIARNPIEDVVGQYVQLTRKGGNLFGLCPFHSEKTPSFSVAPDKQIYYCFGCHKGGGAINFIMDQESLDYPDAVRFLAKRAGLEVPEDAQYASTYKKQERLWALCKEAARFFHEQLYQTAGREARDYLTKRALSKQTVTRFGLGFAPNAWTSLLEAMTKKGYTKQELMDAGLAVASKEKGSIYDRFRNRLMFPIIDVRGNVIGFGGRVMDDSTPKYLNSPETVIFNKRKNLFALNVVKKSKQGRIILTEGYMDAIALHQHGFDCAVASLGTSLTEEHANILARYTKQVIITYDGDEAGQNATRRAISMLEKTGVQVKVLRMQGAKDPDEFLKKYGADRFKLLLERSENHVEYRLLSLQKQFDLTADDQRVEFLKQATKLIASLPNAVEREVYGSRAAEAGGITPEAMELEVKKAYKQRLNREQKKQDQKNLTPAVLQHQTKAVRYDNVRSATAERLLIRMTLKEPALLEKCRSLDAEQFSVPLLGRTYALLKECYQDGRTVSLAVLGEGLSPEELSSVVSAIESEHDIVINEKSVDDSVRIISLEYERKQNETSDQVSGEAQLMSFREKKRFGGTDV